MMSFRVSVAGILTFILISAFFSPFPAHAQSAQDLEKRIQDLKRQVERMLPHFEQVLNAKIDQAIEDRVARQMQDRLDAFRAEMQREMESLRRDLEQRIRDLEMQVQSRAPY